MSGSSNNCHQFPYRVVTCDFQGPPTQMDGDQPLYQVGGELQSVVPTVNDVLNPKEPTKEVQDLFDFEKWLLKKDFACRDCGSQDHASGLCKQNEAAWKALQDVPLEDIVAKEQAARQVLSGGVAQGAPICKFHAGELKEALTRHKTAYNPDAPFPDSHEGLISQTALLPMCETCFGEKTLPNTNKRTVRLDTCLCAIGVITSSCFVCDLGRVNAMKCTLVTHRTLVVGGQEVFVNGQPVTVGWQEVVSCRCSKLDQASRARECAGCGGTVTLPTTNFAGNRLIFQAGAKDPSVIPKQPVTQQQPLAALHGGNQEASSALTTYQLFNAGEIAMLEMQGLKIATPVTHTDERAVTDPQSRLAKLTDNMLSSTVFKETDVDNVLITCGFEEKARATVRQTLATTFHGLQHPENMNQLTALALNITVRGYAGDIIYASRPATHTEDDDFDCPAEPVERTDAMRMEMSVVMSSLVVRDDGEILEET